MKNLLTVRAAAEADVSAIHRLLEIYAARAVVLSRSEEDIRFYLGNFVVAEIDGVVRGCAAVRDFGNNLLEVRSLVVEPGFQGKGIGRAMVEAIIAGLRIRRRHNREPAGVLRFGELCIDLGLREVRRGEETASFTALEFDLLAFLAQNPNQVFSYAQLYDRVWKSPMNRGLHNMQVCMARVRQKLDQLCPGESYIETVRRRGYRFRPGKKA